MSDYNTPAATTGHLGTAEKLHVPDTHSAGRTERRLSTETKASYKTSELIVFILAVLGVLIAAAMVDKPDFGPQEAWKYITFLSIGYMVSRGLAKAGSSDPYTDHNDNR